MLQNAFFFLRLRLSWHRGIRFIRLTYTVLDCIERRLISDLLRLKKVNNFRSFPKNYLANTRHNFTVSLLVTGTMATWKKEERRHKPV